MSRYPIPAARHQVEADISRSRFITTLAPVDTLDEARAFIDELRETYADATHNCWAFLVGKPGTSTQIGMSDDGEPSGTAGRPMLNVLTHSGVGDIAAVVTRYYGGTKLGKGGLVRAYSGGVQLALESLPREEKVARVILSATIDYTDVTLMQRLIAECEVQVVKEEYGAAVIYELAVPADTLARFEAALVDQTHGRAQVVRED